jgi:hypothetical protein
MIRTIWALGLAGLSSCVPGSGPNGCIDEGDCEGLAICTEFGTCQEVECRSPSHCNLGYTCTDNACVEGCSTDDDCLAGQTCGEDGQCADYGCRTTELDCGYGERCNTGTGQCQADPAPHCEPSCTVDLFGDSCELADPAASCFCFGSISGNACVGATYCLVQCSTGADPCPRGYSCVATSNGDYCAADCEFVSQF